MILIRSLNFLSFFLKMEFFDQLFVQKGILKMENHDFL